jgi:hypothetical protein
MNVTIKKCALLTVATMMALDLTGCAKSPSSSPLSMQLQFGSYTTAQHRSLFWKLFEIPEANAAVTSLQMCFKRLRFKAVDENTTDPATNSGNVDFQIGEITISAAGASLGTVQVPAGTYRRIEFDLDPSCASGKSLQVINANGSFSTTQSITIKFSGSFDANADGTLTLGVQTILNQLNSYNAPADLKVTAEAISGVLAN